MSKDLSFWEHLDELKVCLTKIIIAVVLTGMVLFCFKEELFGIILAPQSDEFITYRLLHGLIEPFHIKLINTGLAKQFTIHMNVSIYAGVMLASPYIIYQLYQFIAPALFTKEKQYALRAILFSYLMFILGIALSYFLIFPFTFKFLGSYQVSESVENMISLQSYIDTLMMLSFMMGIIFELPILCWLFGKIGIINNELMADYRKHAIVAILVVAAIITPTSDIFTLLLVAIPMIILYEISILMVRKSNSSKP